MFALFPSYITPQQHYEQVSSPQVKPLSWSALICYNISLNTRLHHSEVANVWDFCPGLSEEHTSELQSPCNLVCRLLLEKKKKTEIITISASRSTTPTSRQQSAPGA